MPGASRLPELLPSIAPTLIEALAGAKIGVTVMVDDGDTYAIVYQNESAREIHGYDMEEVVGRDPFCFIAPESLAALEDRRGRAMRGEPVPPTVETRVLRKGGGSVRVELWTSRMKLEGRDAVVSFMRDVSERAEAQAALRKSEARFRQLIETVPEAIGVAHEGRFLYANPALARMLGYGDARAIIGRALTDFVVPEEADVLAERIALVTRNEPRAPHEYRMRRADGTVVAIEASAIAIEFEGLPAILGVSRDITERKAMIEQVVRSDRMALVGTLAAGVAHEINNPLAYVSLILERLQNELPLVPREPARVDDLLSIVEEARGGTRRVAAIVRDLRVVSRPDDASEGTADLRRVLESSIKIAENEIRHRARLVVDLGEGLTIEGSEARVGQVCLNLLVNAVQAIPEGDPEGNEVRVVARSAGGMVVFEVTDTGPGIPLAVRTRIFDPFFTTKPIGVGTGLGLSICQSIVGSLGGTISVACGPRCGTTFRVSLPWRKPAPAVAPRVESAPASRARVLVVDDEPVLAATLGRALEPDNQVTVVTSGRAALDELTTRDFDVILCDLMMPGVSGIDVHAELARARPTLARRMAFMTGGAFTARARQFLEQERVPWLEKPIERGELRAFVRTALERIEGTGGEG